MKKAAKASKQQQQQQQQKQQQPQRQHQEEEEEEEEDEEQQQQQQQQLRKQAVVLVERKAKKGKAKVKNPTFKKPLPPIPLKRGNDEIGETVEEELNDFSGFNSTQGESIYEDFDNNKEFRDSDFDES